MKKYIVVVEYVDRVQYEIEANSEAEAKETALDECEVGEFMNGTYSVFESHEVSWSGDEVEIVRKYVEMEIASRAQPFWHVHLYLTDRAYGGPEEGGWYYDCGMPEEHAQNGLFMDEDSAVEAARVLNDTVAPVLNEGRNADTGSVLSEGCYRFFVGQGEAKPFPSVIPHYE